MEHSDALIPLQRAGNWSERVAATQLAREVEAYQLTPLITTGMAHTASRRIRTQLGIRTSILLMLGVLTTAGATYLAGVILAQIAAHTSTQHTNTLAAVLGVAAGTLYHTRIHTPTKRLAAKILHHRREPLLEYVTANTPLAALPARTLTEKSWQQFNTRERLKDATSFKEWEALQGLPPRPDQSLQQLVDQVRH